MGGGKMGSHSEKQLRQGLVWTWVLGVLAGLSLLAAMHWSACVGLAFAFGGLAALSNHLRKRWAKEMDDER
jgi:hypothetical protein